MCDDGWGGLDARVVCAQLGFARLGMNMAFCLHVENLVVEFERALTSNEACESKCVQLLMCATTMVCIWVRMRAHSIANIANSIYKLQVNYHFSLV